MLWKEICNLYLVTDLYSFILRNFFKLLYYAKTIEYGIETRPYKFCMWMGFERDWQHSEKCQRTFRDLSHNWECLRSGAVYRSQPHDDYDCKCNR